MPFHTTSQDLEKSLGSASAVQVLDLQNPDKGHVDIVVACVSICRRWRYRIFPGTAAWGITCCCMLWICLRPCLRGWGRRTDDWERFWVQTSGFHAQLNSCVLTTIHIHEHIHTHRHTHKHYIYTHENEEKMNTHLND